MFSQPRFMSRLLHILHIFANFYTPWDTALEQTWKKTQTCRHCLRKFLTIVEISVLWKIILLIFWIFFSHFSAFWNLIILLEFTCLSYLHFIIWVFKKSDQLIRLSIQLEYKENFYLELECGPAQPYLFYLSFLLNFLLF